MLDFLKENDGVKSVKSILNDADGRVVGRTRLQKIGYLLSACGLEDTFTFHYKHYGPFSRELAEAVSFAELAGIVTETSKEASWGGNYSIFDLVGEATPSTSVKSQLIQEACSVNSVVLELAATAAFLSASNYPNPWSETKKRKPKKATDERLRLARQFFDKISSLNTPLKLGCAKG